MDITQFVEELYSICACCRVNPNCSSVSHYKIEVIVHGEIILLLDNDISDKDLSKLRFKGKKDLLLIKY